jgi:hypothetical protein
MNIRFLAILFHFVPLKNFWTLFRQFVPGDMRATGVDLHHGDAIINWAYLRAEVAADAIFFAHNWLKHRAHLSVELEALHVDALVCSVVASDVAEVAMNALVRIDASNSLEAQVEIAEVGNAMN